MEFFIKLRTVTWYFNCKMSILLWLLNFIKLLECWFLSVCSVNFFDRSLEHIPREFTRKGITLNDHRKSFSVEFIQYTNLVVVFKQTRNIISMVVIKCDIDSIGVSDSSFIFIFRNYEDWEVFIKTYNIVVDRSIFTTVIMVSLH